MTSNFENLRWDGLLTRSQPQHKVAEFAQFHCGRNILITGAGGSIGSALARSIAAFRPRSLVLLDSSEQNLFHIHTQLSAMPKAGHVPILGSVTDDRCLEYIFERYQPDVIYHSAALKHVPLMEMNPFAVVQNNTFGTDTLAMTARRFGPGRMVMASTDKAVNPHSIMGASKRLAELVLLAMSDNAMPMTSIRLGNVLGSEGSVVPHFLQQIERGGPVTVTHPEVDRYFFSMEDTVSCIFSAAVFSPPGGGICAPAMGEPVKICDLARYLVQQTSTANIAISYTGLRAGDKLHEEFATDREIMPAEAVDGLHWIESPRLPEAEFEGGIAGLKEALAELNLAKLLATLARLVPEYQISDRLREQVALEAAT